MKILNARQIKALELATLDRQSLSAAELMERAAAAWVDDFLEHLADLAPHFKVAIVCGSGNNGGDGWAIASLLAEEVKQITVFDCKIGTKSTDCRRMKEVLLDEALRNVSILSVPKGSPIPDFRNFDVLIDALFGIGLSRPISGYWAAVVEAINKAAILTIAVDLPSGLYADQASEGAIVRATSTLSFGTPKLALFAAENYPYVGQWEILDIDLDLPYEAELPTPYNTLEALSLIGRLHHRSPFDHKGTFGHALIIAGSHGKIGAATLSARAAMRAGAGLVSVHLPKCGYPILQISFPEAMCSVDPHEFVFSSPPDLKAYKAIGIGPGLGTDPLSVAGLKSLLQTAQQTPLVIDADALNILAAQPELLALVPKNSILTPHPGEFERLFGHTANSFDRWELQRQKAQELAVIIVLKGGFTSIAMPNGDLLFNTSGNPGMATAGTGDVLTGMICGLLAQAYEPTEAALLGVCLHGIAGDIAALETTQESLLASDLIDRIGAAFSDLREPFQPDPF